MKSTLITETDKLLKGVKLDFDSERDGTFFGWVRRTLRPSGPAEDPKDSRLGKDKR